MASASIEPKEIAQAVGAIALIGAILGVAAYVFAGISNPPTSNAAVWLFVLGGAAIAVLWATAEWLLNSLVKVAEWRSPEQPLWKRVVAYAFITAFLGVLLFFVPLVNWLSGAG
jgi:hypothetical protein